MADQLATPGDLVSLVQADSLDLSTAVVVIEACTAVVQEAAGNQRLIRVVDDVLPIMGTTDSWLELPQRPVVSVASVTRDDGETVTIGTGLTADYKLVGNRLWCRFGWQVDLGWPAYDTSIYGRIYSTGGYGNSRSPTVASVIYTHGYADGSQDLQLARAAVLGLGRGIVSNAKGANSESIDDYSVTYAAASAAMEASPTLRASLRRKYGRRAGLARIG